MPLLSVIVPVYKVEKFLDECVQSILNQTFNDFELILVDDGSPDNCPAMCDCFAEKDSRISVIHKKNGGSSSARNQGFNVAKGDYILFIDSDDKYKTLDGFAALADRINKYHEDVIQIASEDVYQDTNKRQLVRGNYNFDIINKSDKNTTINYLFSVGQFAGSAWLICVKRLLLIENDITFPIGFTAEDYGWLMRVLSTAKSYGAVDKLVYEYKKGVDGSITSKPRKSGIEGIHIALDFWKSLENCPQGLNEFAAYIYLIMLLNYAGLSKEEQANVKNIVKVDAMALKKTNSFKHIAARYLINIFGVDFISAIILKIR